MTIDEPGQYTDRSVKKAFAELRKAIKAYRHELKRKREWLPYLTHDVTGNAWKLHRDFLYHFVDWFVWPAPLDELIKQAHQRAEERRIEYLREECLEWSRIRSSYTYQFDLSVYYHVLGLEQTATADEIKKQYRLLAKQHHPDVGGDAEKFKQISDAYTALIQQKEGKNL
jgi:hypothetical protein